jgi:hypothetical protein
MAGFSGAAIALPLPCCDTITNHDGRGLAFGHAKREGPFSGERFGMVTRSREGA